jgi:branched-chain amino acid transport system permease protein
MQRFVSPAPFDLKAGIEYLLMAVLGGSGHIAGALIGAASVALTKNWLQDILPRFTTNAGNLEIVVFGVLFIALLHNARGGLVPLLKRFRPTNDGDAVRDVVVDRNAMPIALSAMPSSGSQLLHVEALSKHFGGLKAVNDVTFSVATGELVALIGPNGAGKSTTFNLIAGALPPTAGKVSFAGADMTGSSSLAAVERRLARTFQHVKLRPTMSVLENVMLGTYSRTHAGFWRGALRRDRMEEAQARATTLAALEAAGLAEFAMRDAGTLSLGQQRLVEIARALAADPVLLMLDEPAAGLRALEKKALADLLRRLRERGLTILLVEHDMDFVMNLADRIVVLDFGQKLAEGAPAAIRANAMVQDAYLGGVA